MTVTDVSPSTDAAAAAPQPRYPGSVPFSDTDVDRRLFRGRDREAVELLHSILSERLVVLYGASGTGKTSLLRARIVRELRDREMWPVVVRLDQPDRPLVEQVEERVRQQASGVVELVQATAEPPSLRDLFAGMEIWRGDTLLTPVVIFDQFEELFTLDWDPERRAEFIADFARLVHGDAGPLPLRLKVILSLREDALGELEELAADVPSILRHRFRLRPLDLDQAREAIVEPALLEDGRLATPPFAYGEGAVDLMVDFLSRREVRGQPVRQTTVEPAQLQIVCQYVEDVLLPSKAAKGTDVIEVAAADLGGQEGLNRVLEEFYGRQLARFDDPAPIRELCERGLISPSRRRMSREEEEIEREHGVGKAELARLVERRLVRAEPRVGSVYYELAHDSLVEPIIAYRDRQAAAAGARRRRRVLAGGGIVAALVTIAGIGFGIFGLSGGGGVQSSYGEVVNVHRVPGPPTALAAGPQFIWVAIDSDGIVCIDPASGSMEAAVIPGVVADVAADPGGGAWAVRFEVEAFELVYIPDDCGEPIPVTGAEVGPVDGLTAAVAAGEGRVWVVVGRPDGPGRLFRIVPDEPDVLVDIEVGSSPVDVEVGLGTVFISDFESSMVSLVGPVEMTREDLPTAAEPIGLAVGPDALWVAAEQVTRLDAESDPVFIPVGERPYGVAVADDGGSVWVTDSQLATVSRIDPATNSVVAVFGVEGRPEAVAAGHGSIWVANRSGETVTEIDPVR